MVALGWGSLWAGGFAVAGLGADRYTRARGTSFAAPLVAGLLAAGAQSRELSVAALARLAHDSGAPGRDVVYGHGVVGRELRTDPAIVQAR